MNSTEYINATIGTAYREGDIGADTAIEILGILIDILNQDGNDDRHIDGMTELHAKVTDRYGWVMQRKEPMWS